MQNVLIASDAGYVVDEVRTVIDSPEMNISVVSSGPEVLRFAQSNPVDLCILDFQIGAMGGVAASLELRLEESGRRLDHIPVLLLLDRRADVFMARRAMAEGWIVKPLDPIRIRRAVSALLEGGMFHDTTLVPVPINASQSNT